MPANSRPRHSPDHLHQAQNVTLFLGEEVLGGVLLLAGMAMSITLFLIPIGIPLALVGVALLVSATQPT